MFHVLRGVVVESRDGVVQRRAGPGAWLGEGALFEAAHDRTAQAEGPALVEVFAKSQVLLTLSAHPHIALGFAAHLAKALDRERALAEILRLPRAKERVAAWLSLLGANRELVSLDRSLTSAALEVGLTREAFYRALAALEKSGRLARPAKRSFRLIEDVQ